jgi:perosamine synthetase
MLEPGDEVLVPSFTFIATASMVVRAGAVPVFCDVDPKTWTLDPEDVKRRITPKTRAIAGVHIFGNACDMTALTKIAEGHHLKLIWDAAQSLGTLYNGRDVSAYPHATCLSFYPTKNMTTGEGGMVVTDDEALARKIRLLKCHGESEKYVHTLVGFNYRMSEIEAAIGLTQMRKLDGFLASRKKIAQRYLRYFQQHPDFQTQQIQKGCESSFNYFSVLVRSKKFSRDEFVNALRKEGVPCAIHYPRPLHLQPCFANLSKEPLSHSVDIASHVLSLPMHPYLSDEDVDFVTGTIDRLTGVELTK